MLHHPTFSSRNVLDGQVLDSTNFCTRSITQNGLHTGVLACDLFSRRVFTALESRTRRKRGNQGFNKADKDIHHGFLTTCLDLSHGKSDASSLREVSADIVEKRKWCLLLVHSLKRSSSSSSTKQSAYATIPSPKAEFKSNASCVCKISVDENEMLIMDLSLFIKREAHERL
jgi:hypothetical protein